MADVRLPGTLAPLFPGLPRRLEIEAATVLAAIDELDAQWPGLRDRLVAEGPSLRPHIHVYVDGERSVLDTPLEPRSRLDVIAAISGGSAAGDHPARMMRQDPGAANVPPTSIDRRARLV